MFSKNTDTGFYNIICLRFIETCLSYTEGSQTNFPKLVIDKVEESSVIKKNNDKSHKKKSDTIGERNFITYNSGNASCTYALFDC